MLLDFQWTVSRRYWRGWSRSPDPWGWGLLRPLVAVRVAFIIAEMFKVEIIIDPGGGVKDVKVTHLGDPSVSISAPGHSYRPRGWGQGCQGHTSR